MSEKTKTRTNKKDDLLIRLERLESALEQEPKRVEFGNGAKTQTVPNYSSDLEKRIGLLEKSISKQHEEEEETPVEEHPLGYCNLPVVPPRVLGPDVSNDRARMIVYIGKKWVNGTKLRYWFFDSGPAAGGNEQKDLVRQGFEVWKNVAIGIKFEEVRDIGSAEIRIGFVRGDGAWSYVGRDVVDIPGRTERTMNFGWDLTADPRRENVAVHEIGHTLGFPHEHQNPFAGIVWDEEAVYRYFGGPPNNWPRTTTEFNVLRKLSTDEVQGSNWDPDSIMHYGFPPRLILQPEQYFQNGLFPHGGLSPRDIAQAKVFYPPIDDNANPELKPFRSQTLSLAPAQQANFNIQPTVTRSYTMQTFGGSDTVMVLFEDTNGDLRYVAGDDDSGTDRNARITARLVAGQRYVLRLRMYSSFDSGEIAVMMW